MKAKNDLHSHCVILINESRTFCPVMYWCSRLHYITTSSQNSTKPQRRFVLFFAEMPNHFMIYARFGLFSPSTPRNANIFPQELVCTRDDDDKNKRTKAALLFQSIWREKQIKNVIGIALAAMEFKWMRAQRSRWRMVIIGWTINRSPGFVMSIRSLGINLVLMMCRWASEDASFIVSSQRVRDGRNEKLKWISMNADGIRGRITSTLLRDNKFMIENKKSFSMKWIASHALEVTFGQSTATHKRINVNYVQRNDAWRLCEASRRRRLIYSNNKMQSATSSSCGVAVEVGRTQHNLIAQDLRIVNFHSRNWESNSNAIIELQWKEYESVRAWMTWIAKVIIMIRSVINCINRSFEWINNTTQHSRVNSRCSSRRTNRETRFVAVDNLSSFQLIESQAQWHCGCCCCSNHICTIRTNWNFA